MEIVGQFKIVNSQLNDKTNTSYINYKSNKEELILKSETPKFRTIVVGSYIIDIDTKAKLFEYVADIAEDGKEYIVNLLYVKLNVVANKKRNEIKIDLGLTERKGMSKMRVKNDLTYQEYKDGVYDAFNLLGRKGCETAEDIINYMTDEDDYFLISGSTSLALWIISIGEYEIRHNILEERVLEQISYHIPRYKMDKYKDVTDEERKELEKDIEFIKNNVNLWKLTKEELEAE